MVEIDKCKLQNKKKVQDLFATNNSRMAGQGLNKITGYKQSKKSVDVKDKAAFAEEMNTFYARFDSVDYSVKHDNIRVDLGVSVISVKVIQGLNKQKAP